MLQKLEEAEAKIMYVLAVRQKRVLKGFSWAPGWLSRLSVRLLVVISWFCEFKPRVELYVDGAEPAWHSLFPFLSAPLLLVFSLSK